MSNLWLGLRLARRELRGGTRGLRIVLACLALGVAAIAAVGSLRAAIQAGLQADGARLLGGDFEIRAGYQPVPPEAVAWATSRGAAASSVLMTRAMLVAPSGERTLVELKLVDQAYPLYGALRLEPGQLERGTVAVEPAVMERLGLRVGDELRLGEARLRLAAVIAEEPDKVASPTIFGPRAMIRLDDLAETQLAQPGSMINHEVRFRVPEGVDAARLARELRAAFPQAPWRLRMASQAEPGVNRFLDRAASFLTLAGLTALLVGGIGVATGVRAWLFSRGRTIAILRCMGAPAGAIFATYLWQVMALAVLGTVIGLVAGFGLTALAARALSGVLPVPPVLVPYWQPLGLAALYGLLTALAFSLWPLGRAREIPGAALFRDSFDPARARPRWWLVALNGAAVLALVGLVVLTAEQPIFALWFCVGAGLALGMFRLGATGLMALVRRLPRLRRPSWRLGLANLHRPGAPTPIMVVALGIGLTTLTAIAQIQGNLTNAISSEMPGTAPNFFFIDIQPAQVPAFDALVRGNPAVTEMRRVPSLRARIVSVKGVPSDQVRVTPETAWALNGDRGLTYTGPMPADTRLTAGAWWAEDYRGPPLVSFDAAIAAGWNVGVGDEIVVNVLGRDVTLTVANLRQVAWRGLRPNFTLIASPGLLEAAPHTHIATVRNSPSADGPLLRQVTDAFPNVSGVRVREVLEGVAALLGRLAGALTATGSVTLLAGMLVLAGAVAAGQGRRVREAVVLKTVGATRGQVRSAFLVEFGVLGLAAGGLAALAGTAASWGVTRFIMRQDWVFLPGTLAATILGCVAVTLVFGYIGTALALRARPAPLLRNE